MSVDSSHPHPGLGSLPGEVGGEVKPRDVQGKLAFLMMGSGYVGSGYVGTSERPAPVSSNLDTSSLLRRNILNQPSQKPEIHQLPSPLSPQTALYSEPPAKLLAIAWAPCLRQELVSEGAVRPGWVYAATPPLLYPQGQPESLRTGEDRAASHPGEGQEAWRRLTPGVFGDRMCLFLFKVSRLKDPLGSRLLVQGTCSPLLASIPWGPYTC